MLKLRDYQKSCLKAHADYFALRKGNPLFVVPTGGGKSLIIAEFLKNTLLTWPDQRIIVLTHNKELIQQNYDELISQWEILAPVGIYSSGIGRRETDCPITFAGIQSVWSRVNKPSKAADALGRFDLVLIDECHLVPKSGTGRYVSYLAWLKEKNPKLKVLGYTATPFRLDGGMLHKGEGRIFTDIAYDVKLKKLIDDKYLSPLVAMMPKKTISTKGVKTSAGDFNSGEVNAIAMSGDNVTLAVNEILETAKKENRKHWLVFACGREHAEQMLEQIKAAGVTAELVMGHTPKKERERIIKEAKEGKITCVVNVGVLTTGFNWPRCDMLAVLRPTQSAALYVQIMGRGMRTFPGKENCLVLDFGENVLRHGPIDDIRVMGEGRRTNRDEDLGKACPECDTISARNAKVCPTCKHEFIPESMSPTHLSRSSKLSPMSGGQKRDKKYEAECNRIEYHRHEKQDKPPSFKVTYWCGMRRMCEWVCIEHTGFAQRKAAQWWVKRGNMPVPTTVEEALKRSKELRQPKLIVVQEDGKYERIVDVSFTGQPILIKKKPGANDQDTAPQFGLQTGKYRKGSTRSDWED